MTSASSSTNTLIFFGSMNFSFVHQSSMVPGVPITICSCSLLPRGTEEYRKNSTIILKNKNKTISHIHFYSITRDEIDIFKNIATESERELTFISSDSIHKFHFWIVFAHLLNYFSSLKSQFVRRRHTQALRKTRWKNMVRYSYEIEFKCSSDWGNDTSKVGMGDMLYCAINCQKKFPTVRICNITINSCCRRNSVYNGFRQLANIGHQVGLIAKS